MGLHDRDWYWKAIDEQNKKIETEENKNELEEIKLQIYQSKLNIKARFDTFLVWTTGLAFLGWIGYMGLQILSRVVRLLN